MQEFLEMITDFINNTINQGHKTSMDMTDIQEEDQDEDVRPVEEEEKVNHRPSSEALNIDIEEAPVNTNVIQPRKIKKKQKKIMLIEEQQ